MKILRMFDSLKFMRAMFVAVVAATFILNVAHADTTAIQSVIAYGKTEQSATPTPTNPVPIMTNNGVLKVSPNICTWNQSLTATGNGSAAIAYSGIFTPSGYPFKQNTQYTISFDVVGDNITYSASGNLLYFIVEYTDGSVTYPGVTGGNYQNGRFVWNTSADKTVRRIGQFNKHARWTGGTITVSNMRIEEGSTATTGVYADGMIETIRDSAGHTATAQMLLSVGDYKDEQNITTGAITRKVGVRVFDGTENWYFAGASYPGVFFLANFITDARTIAASEASILLCSHFVASPKSSAQSITANNVMSINSNAHTPNSVWIYSNNFSTVAQFKSWLAEQYANGTPVIVLYPLATETTENVTTQTLTTAPVRQTTGSILGMPIEVVFGDGTREWVREMITIATTKYNEQQFAPVETRLDAAVAAVDTVVSQTMSQAQAIDTIATSKQTRPDEGCDAKYCLLVEDEDGTPHWYPIAGANGVAHNLPAGYTELQYIESTGTQYINTGIVTQNGIGFDVTFLTNNSTVPGSSAYGAILGGRVYSGDNDFQITTYTPGGSTRGTIRNGLSTPVISAKISTNTKLHISLINDVITYDDGTTSPVSSYEYTTGKNIYLFGLNNNDSFVQSGAGCRIYNAKLLVGSNVVFDGIPAKQGTTVGMYDMVSGQFFTNAGTGTFTAGPDM